MSLNDKYAYIVLSFLTFLNSLALSKYFRFLVIPKNKGIINKNIHYSYILNDFYGNGRDL